MTKWLGRDASGRITDVDLADAEDTEGIGIVSGSASPVGLSAQPGTIYRRTNGTVWIKTGSGNDDWSEVVTT